MSPIIYSCSQCGETFLNKICEKVICKDCWWEEQKNIKVEKSVDDSWEKNR